MKYIDIYRYIYIYNKIENLLSIWSGDYVNTEVS